MTCNDVQPNLLSFHLGAAAPAEREHREAHLLACPGCLRGYFDAKRASEDVPLSEVAPSPAIRDRLRLAVAQRAGSEGAMRTPPRRRTWMMGAVVAALALLAIAFSYHPAVHSEPPPTLLIDSDQAQASLSVL